MAKNSKQATNMYSPVPKKGKGRASKKKSTTKGNKNYEKPYRGQGRG